MKIDTKEFLEEKINNGTLKFTEPENLYFSLENIEKLKKDNVNYNEEVLADSLANDFSNQIKERGKEYYDAGNVESVYKNNNMYIAKVYGASNQLYDVQIIITDEKNADYSCSCPCDFPCKHEYAVLMAIANFDYFEVELKPQIKEKDYYIYNRLITYDGITFGTGIQLFIDSKDSRYKKFIQKHNYKNSTDLYRCLYIYGLNNSIESR